MAPPDRVELELHTKTVRGKQYKEQTCTRITHKKAQKNITNCATRILPWILVMD